MITDIVARRYADVSLRTQYFEEDRRFMNQAAAMIMDPLWTGYKTEKLTDTAEACLKASHDILALELGRDYLSDRYWFQKYTWNGNTNTQTHTYSYANICKNFLTKMPDDIAKGDAWIKDRLSLVEITFRMRAQQVAFANAELPNCRTAESHCRSRIWR